MHIWSLVVFTLAIGVGMAAPGPAIVTLLARVLATGRGDNIGFAAGLIAGDLLWFAAAVFGLAALATEARAVMVVLKYLGAAYLLYLAWKLWTAPVAAPASDPLPGFTPPRSLWRGAAGGLAVALANAKAMMFYLALLPSLIEFGNIGLPEYLGLSAVIVLVYSVVLLAYINAAHRARAMFRSPRTLTLINRGSGTVMAGAAIAVVTR